MLRNSLVTYGGQKVNIKPRRYPNGEIDASEWNLVVLHVSQASHTLPKYVGRFTATTTAAPTTVSVDSFGGQFGDTAPFQPTISKTATGLYTVDFAASYDDELGNTETLGFIRAEVDTYCADSSKTTDAFLYDLDSGSIKIAVKEFTGGAWALSDQTASGSVAIAVQFTIY